MSQLNNVITDNALEENKAIIEEAVAKSTAMIADIRIGTLAKACGLSADNFGNLTTVVNQMPEILLAEVLAVPQLQHVPVLGHYEIGSLEIFPLYYLCKAPCPDCGEMNPIYRVIMASPQGCTFSDCAVHGLTPVASPIKTIADVRKHLKYRYNFG